MATINDRRFTPRGHGRRQMPRLLVKWNVQIHLRQGPDATKPPKILFGFTYDISPDGLSVVLPALDCEVQELFDLGDPLDVVLATTPRTIKVKAAAVHCETDFPLQVIKSACIGMRVQREDDSYHRYVEFIREF